MNQSQHQSSSKLHDRLRNRSGQALVEFSLTALLLVVLLFGIVDFGRVLHLKQIMINVSREGANLASRGTDFTNTISAVIVSAQPLDINQDGYIILTAVYRDGTGKLSITEQVGRGGVYQSSKVGTVGGSSIKLPNSFIPSTNQTLYVAEVFYGFDAITPLGRLMSFTLPSTFYDVSYF